MPSRAHLIGRPAVVLYGYRVRSAGYAAGAQKHVFARPKLRPGIEMFSLSFLGDLSIDCCERTCIIPARDAVRMAEDGGRTDGIIVKEDAYSNSSVTDTSVHTAGGIMAATSCVVGATSTVLLCSILEFH